MKNKKNKTKKFLKASGFPVVLMAIFCVSILFGAITLKDVFDYKYEEEYIYARQPHPYALADNDPTGDNGGYIYYYTVTHDPTPADSLNANISHDAANVYEESDVIDSEMGNETSHTVTFDFVVKFRVNDTTTFNNSIWDTDLIDLNITVDFDFQSDVAWTEMSYILIANNSDFAWYHGYINNSGTGYDLQQNEKFNCTLNCTLWW